MANQKDDTPSVKQSKVPLYISLGIIAALVLSYFFIPGVQDFFNNAWRILTSDDEQRISAWVDQFGFWGPIVIISAMILQMFLIVIPTPLLMVVSVLAYGPIWGALLVLGAVFCASSIGYAIGAYLGPAIVGRILGRKSEKKVESFIEDYGFWAVVVTRLSPFLSNDAISFVGGILRMGYWRFIGATLIGISPLAILIAHLGQNSQRLKDGLLWGSIISIVLFIAYVWWDKKRKG
ncbi:Alkaline phosphatase like protein [Fulvivirga imtechensis AK7]|uniref:TVP38/TMEM64 family membrane protein n=1 Tax=Fulvivirga imtechensis AK7 TaxID=1237149 RepID=L8K222_9BACT|nr:TVP38/TMEM64 family protein [Fulvivirga imtechensis]ELR73507.1 Alkaline phosphatase like protein [Fulvivirga imtechensis AK7]